MNQQIDLAIASLKLAITMLEEVKKPGLSFQERNNLLYDTEARMKTAEDRIEEFWVSICPD